MSKVINIKIYKNNKLENEYNHINAIISNKIIFTIDKIKTIIDEKSLIRENEEFEFILNFIDKKASYKLKEHNYLLDIIVEKCDINKADNIITIIYKLESDEKETKIIIKEDE